MPQAVFDGCDDLGECQDGRYYERTETNPGSANAEAGHGDGRKPRHEDAQNKGGA